MPEACFVYLLAWKQDLAYFESRLMQGRYFAYNGWQMHWPVPGYREKRGVCLYKLISQTKRVSRPTSCFGSKQTAVGGWGGPPSTWQNKMGPQHDSEYNISANKRAVYWDDTSERLCCLSCKFRHKSVSGGGGVREFKKKKETRGETVSSCFVFRSGSD